MNAAEKIRLVLGAGQLVVAGRIARSEHDRASVTTSTRIIRLLGVRQLVQGGLLARTNTSRRAHVVGGVVDILHASTMVIVAIVSRTHRRAAAIDGCVATSFAIAELRR